MTKLTVAAAVVGLLASTTPAYPAMAAPQGTTITWGATCPSAGEGVVPDPTQVCGTLRVPLDYRRPTGRTISVGVSRIPARVAAHRHGVLLFNPGGPGGPGLNMPSEMIQTGMADEIRDQYDLIGFDPRGVGQSTPISCGLSGTEVAEAALPFPAPDGSITRNVALARSMADRCWAGAGDLLPYLTTANTARDMDLIRQALGEQKISYFGISYGTYLGAVYSSMFNQFTDRVVLDSAVGPDLIWYDMFRTFGAGATARFPDAAAVLAGQPDLGLGSTVEQVTTGYLALASRLDTNPIALPDTDLRLDGNALRQIVFQALYSDAAFPALTEVLRVATGGTSGIGVDAIKAILRPVQSGDASVDNTFALGTAVLCGDAAWPRDTATYQRNVLAERAANPLTAGMPANIRACAFWHTLPIEAPVAITPTGQRNILQLQNRRDPATNWDNGQRMRHALGQRAAFVGVDAGGHGVYTRNSCASRVAEAFLTKGILPAADMFCSAQPR